MPTPAYVKFTSQNDGALDGSVTIAGREGTSEVHEFHHHIEISTDIHSGMATGKRRHNPATLIKEVDKISPILYDHLTNGTSFPTIQVDWYRIEDDGSEFLYFKHVMEQCRLVSMKMIMPHVKDPSKQRFGHLEEVAIHYRKITWEWPDGGIVGYDDWLEAQ